MKEFNFDSFARVNPDAIQCTADIRALPEHFCVDEQLPFTPDGEGGHAFLKIQKRGINTDWLALELAKFAGVPPVAIGYAGLKDRHAVTQQWFSINLEGHTEPNWSEFETDDIRIVESTRHGKKLKRGVLAGNQFTLTLSALKGDKTLWIKALETIQNQGVPNYFGEQRFGHNGNNLNKVDYWFTTGKAPRKRNQKSIYLSAARSWLYNLVLSERIKQDNWNKALDGDSMLLVGTKASLFSVDSVDESIIERMNSMDIHPTGIMWGRGESHSQGESLQLENQALEQWDDWKLGLEKAGLSQERRSLRLFPSDFSWQFLDEGLLELRFSLVAGSYATAIMRELAVITDAQHRKPNTDSSEPMNDNKGDRHG